MCLYVIMCVCVSLPLSLKHTCSDGQKPQAVLNLGPELHELLVDLMCRFSPRQVTPFLETSQSYRLEETVEVSQCPSLLDDLILITDEHLGFN